MRSVFACGMAAMLCLASCAQVPKGAPALSGDNAMEYVRAQVAFGPRPPGSAELEACRAYIEEQLRRFGYSVARDSFVAETPVGPVRMHNLIARKGEAARPVVVLATHYDTKLMKGFVGANDGASSTGLVMELARVLAGRQDGPDCWFVFFDGEEAFVEWSTFDSTYGSRHLAREWKARGVVPRIRALVLLDMIGDRDLDIFYETNSTPRLMNLVWGTARRLGLGGMLSNIRAAIEDDHLPFLDAGVPSVDIIDLDYGPNNSYHHTLADTLDKVSPESLEKVGRLVLGMLPDLERGSY